MIILSVRASAYISHCTTTHQTKRTDAYQTTLAAGTNDILDRTKLPWQSRTTIVHIIHKHAHTHWFVYTFYV